jgi:antidote-toxin recognition MazE-like antitoxin
LIYDIEERIHMSQLKQRRKDDTLNLRVDPALKSEFVSATEFEGRPVAEVLRELMRNYVHRARKRKFGEEARRQSRLVASSPDETEVMRWIRDVSGNDL